MNEWKNNKIKKRVLEVVEENSPTTMKEIIELVGAPANATRFFTAELVRERRIFQVERGRGLISPQPRSQRRKKEG